MKKLGLSKNRILASLVIIASLIFLDYLGLYESINNHIYDLSFRIRGDRDHAKEILLVCIDDRTLERLGRWPIKRSNYALLLKNLHESRIVIFDIIMAEPTGDDGILKEAIEKHGRVFLPLLLDDNKNIRYPSIHVTRRFTGHIYVEQDVDGIVRSIYHTILVNGTFIPSIMSVAYEFITDKPFKRDDKKKYTAIKKGDKIIQYDKMRINYAGGDGTFDRVSFIDVIDGVYPPSFFKDKIVIVGLTVTGSSDVLITPILKDRRGMSGIELQANVLDNLINNNAIIELPVWLRWPITVIMAFGSLLIFTVLQEKMAALLTICLFLFILILGYLAFTVFNLWSPPATYIINVIVFFVVAYIYKFDDAVKVLRETYITLESKLRWKISAEENLHSKKGILSIVTKRGIYEQAKVLTEIGKQLSFEKELADRALMSNINGVVVFDEKGKITLINDYSRRIFEKITGELFSFEGFINSITPYLLEKSQPEEIIKKLKGEEIGITYTLTIPNKEKKYFKVDLSSFKVENSKYFLIIATDITKIKELELLKSHIISVVSHELKSPMTSIKGFSEILYNNLTGKMQNFASIINRESDRLVRFLNTFLDITRIEEGRQPVKLTPVNLISVIEEVAVALKPIGDANRITIKIDLPSGIEEITIDRDLTKQCIYNLVENAIKYSPSEKDVIISLKDEVHSVRIDVIDHGYGIKEEDMPKIFEKFFRSTSEYTKNIKGSGLGLTFVKEAVELQGGRLTFQSTFGKGSVFTILFPKKSSKHSHEN